MFLLPQLGNRFSNPLLQGSGVHQDTGRTLCRQYHFFKNWKYATHTENALVICWKNINTWKTNNFIDFALLNGNVQIVKFVFQHFISEVYSVLYFCCISNFLIHKYAKFTKLLNNGACHILDQKCTMYYTIVHQLLYLLLNLDKIKSKLTIFSIFTRKKNFSTTLWLLPHFLIGFFLAYFHEYAVARTLSVCLSARWFSLQI